LSPTPLLKAADFKPWVPVTYSRIPGYTAIYSGELMETRRPVGRGIRTAAVIYLALSSKQPPCKVPIYKVHESKESGPQVVAGYDRECPRSPIRTQRPAFGSKDGRSVNQPERELAQTRAYVRTARVRTPELSIAKIRLALIFIAFLLARVRRSNRLLTVNISGSLSSLLAGCRLARDR
jgi:hypothetical protein